MSLGKILRVAKDSIAYELGLKSGDSIVSVNGQKLKDIIDMSFAFAEEDIDLLIQHSDGTQEMYSFSKDYDDELGVEFEAAVFDGIRSCANHCYFCFVDQVPPNMRDSLHIKDDDYRLSFLYGNFITMTNMGKADFDRIRKYHLSPLYVSVHTMNMELRKQMLRTPLAGNLIEQLESLEKADIEYHTQIVLCPGLNDGDDLDNTIQKLLERRPYLQSLAIVPVGLTRFRTDCYPLQLFDKEGARKVVAQVKKWQDKNREETGETLIYLSDEFYLLAGEDIPPAEYYDGFPQLDNGIGLTRNFIDEWAEAEKEIMPAAFDKKVKLLVVSGKAIEPIFKKLINSINIPQLDVHILAVENQYYGTSVDVSGLLTGVDIKNAVCAIKDTADFDGVIIPSSAVRAGDDILLDDMTVSELEKQISIPVKSALGGRDLYKMLTNWCTETKSEEREKLYTWQSNAGYTKLKEEENE